MLSLNDERFLIKLFGFLALVGLVFLSGCSSFGTYNPATGRKEFIFISTAEEIALGKNVHKQILEEYKIVSTGFEVLRLQRIGRHVADVSDRQDYQYHFFLIEKDEMNAFTTPGGNIYIFSGLMEKLATDDRIASVLAHEIGHCAARHTVKKFQAALGYNLIGSIVLGQVEGGQAQQIVSMSSNMMMNIVFSSYGRKDEYEADRLGFKYLKLAKYDGNASIEALEVLQKESKDGGAPLILRSHPYLSDRIARLKEEIEFLGDSTENDRSKGLR